MNVMIVAANGTFGRLIVDEALSRGHKVTAFVRKPEGLALKHPSLKVVKGDSTDAQSIADAAKGQDAVISAVGPAHDGSSDPKLLPKTANALRAGLAKAGVKRVIVIGGAGSLEIGGKRLVDTPAIPDAWKPLVLSHIEAFDIYKTFENDWTYFSPAGMFQPGDKKGHFRLGGDRLLTDEAGKSELTYGDGATVVVDELEKAKHVRKRFTAAY